MPRPTIRSARKSILMSRISNSLKRRARHCRPNPASLPDTILSMSAMAHPNLFLFVEPQAGWRHVEVTERRTALDFAHQMKWLVDERYPEAKVIELTLDNLNAHKPASLYEAFEPAEARRILRKINFHYTPKHGSWLNMAEIDLSILQRQCLDRRVPDEQTLKQEVAAWEERRNGQKATIDWRFSLDDARTRLRRLYPSTS